MRLGPIGLGIALASSFALAAAGCEKRADANASYRTRGLVNEVEGSAEELRVEIHHERIPDFKGRDGEPAPMDSMAMKFALGKGVDAALFEPGAKVSVDFDVRWSNSAPLLITKAEPLPETTQLQLGGH
jgi:hypothetical protein